MYTEEYEERGFPIRSFLIKFLIIVIIVLLLIWLLPKFVKPKNEKEKKPVSYTADSEEVYQENINKMQDAAFEYYDEDTLPGEDGKYDKITLKELIDKGYIGELTDHNNKKLDAEDSYIKVTKVEDNKYIMKINLKDSEKEDYVLVNVGHFGYCEKYICKEIEADKDNEEDNSEDTNIKSSVYDDKPIDTGVEEPVIVDESYKYTKTIPAKMSDWSNWSNWQETDCSDLHEVTCDNNNGNCLTEVRIKNSNGICYKSYRNRKVLVSSYTITRWSTKYNQELINNGWTYIGK